MNSSAESIVRLQQDNASYLEQVQRNVEMIEKLQESAQWVDEPIEFVVEPNA
jgi:hypothetical protein